MRLSPFVLIALCLMPFSSPAQVDPQPDGIGIYFDLGATVNATNTTVPGQSVIAYLCITHCSDPVGVFGWYCGIDWGDESPEIYYYGDMTNFLQPPGFALTSGSEWPIWNVGTVMLLARFTFCVPDPGHVVSFQIYPYYFGVFYQGSNYVVVPLNVSSGSFDLPVATINGAPPVPANPPTWGAVKALYRRSDGHRGDSLASRGGPK